MQVVTEFFDKRIRKKLSDDFLDVGGLQRLDALSVILVSMTSTGLSDICLPSSFPASLMQALLLLILSQVFAGGQERRVPWLHRGNQGKCRSGFSPSTTRSTRVQTQLGSLATSVFTCSVLSLTNSNP